MAFGPLYTDLPLAAATATRPATRYVDETSWNALIASFSLWGDNVNANGKNLSNVAVFTVTTSTVNNINVDSAVYLGTTPGGFGVPGLVFRGPSVNPLGFIANSADTYIVVGSFLGPGNVMTMNMATGAVEVPPSFITGTGSVTIKPQNVGAAEGGELQLSDHTGGTWNLDVASSTFRVFHSAGGGARFQITPAGGIQMYLGGTVKTLSVDGSGFVKAT